MKDRAALKAIHGAVSLGHGYSPEVDLLDYVHVSEAESQVLVREIDDAMEIAVLLNRKIIEDLEPLNLPTDFDLASFGSLSVAIEELSHFNLLFFQAAADQVLSPLELEVQAEVDKFSVALEWMEQTNTLNMRNQFFDCLFGELKIGSWVNSSDRRTYEEAHEIARRFCRRLMSDKVSILNRKQILADFFRASGMKKLSFSSDHF